MKLIDAFKGQYNNHSSEINVGSITHMRKLGEGTDSNIVSPPTTVPDAAVSPSSVETSPVEPKHVVKSQYALRPAYIISIELAQDDCHLLCMFLVIFTLSLLLSKK